MSGPKRAADFLRGILQDAKIKASRSDLEDALGTALGPDLAKHCHVAGYRAGKLVVEVDSAPLCAELSGFRKEEIRLTMNAALNKKRIGKITFRMSGTAHV